MNQIVIQGLKVAVFPEKIIGRLSLLRIDKLLGTGGSGLPEAEKERLYGIN